MPTALVTGANRGLGLELTRQLGDAGWRVHACCRDPQAAEELQALARASDRVRLHAMDVTDAKQIATVARSLADEPIDLLLNNAGIAGSLGEDMGANRAAVQPFGRLDYPEWREVLEVNLLGAARVTEALLEHVARSERKLIAMVSTAMGSLALNTEASMPPPGNFYHYRTSKAALNMLTRGLAVDLAPRGITTLALGPGWVRTDMGGPSAVLAAKDSVAGMLKVVFEAGPEQNGRFYAYDGSEVPW